MEIVGARFGYHVDSGAGRTAIQSRKALRGNLEFLHGLGGKLHHGSTNGIVFVVNAVDSDIHVATAIAVHGKDRVAVLRRIVGISRLYARGQVGQVGDDTADQRQLGDLLRSDHGAV